MASCIVVTDVSRSSITFWIDTFMTVLSRTMMNCAEARAMTTDHLPRTFIWRPYIHESAQSPGAHPRDGRAVVGGSVALSRAGACLDRIGRRLDRSRLLLRLHLLHR